MERIYTIYCGRRREKDSIILPLYKLPEAHHFFVEIFTRLNVYAVASLSSVSSFDRFQNRSSLVSTSLAHHLIIAIFRANPRRSDFLRSIKSYLYIQDSLCFVHGIEISSFPPYFNRKKFNSDGYFKEPLRSGAISCSWYLEELKFIIFKSIVNDYLTLFPPVTFISHTVCSIPLTSCSLSFYLANFSKKRYCNW